MTPSGAFGARGASSRTEAPRFRVGRPSPLALRRARLTTTTTIRITSTTRRIPTIAADSTGPRRPVGPLSREDQARADALEHLDLDDDLDDDDDDAVVGGVEERGETGRESSGERVGGIGTTRYGR